MVVALEHKEKEIILIFFLKVYWLNTIYKLNILIKSFVLLSY